MTNALCIFFIVHPYGCFTLSSTQKHTYISTIWELTVYEMPWEENSEERKPALSLKIINVIFEPHLSQIFSEGWNSLDDFPFSAT